MPQNRWLNAMLFWLMLALGAAALAPCLLLPAWLERQAQEEYLAAQRAYLASLEERLTATQTQSEHLKHDPAYVLRLAEEELGNTIELPETELVPIAPSPEIPALEVEDDPDAPPTLAVLFERTIDRHPRLRIFVADPARPFIMGFGGALILAAIVLLGFLRGPRRGAAVMSE